ncbi:acetate--CoA ligase, partial [bacterium]|nr:acetate--CoA ligase [bacterium]
MTNFGNYTDRIAGFDWAAAEKELGYTPGGNLNIGWMCSDRVCEMGKADKLALIWEDFHGTRR